MKKYITLFLIAGTLIQSSFGMQQDEEKLFDAIESNEVKNLERVFQDHPNINVNAQSLSGYTALHMLSHYLVERTVTDPLPIAELLLKHGADVNIKNNGNITPLWSAVQSRNIPYITLLIAKGANPLIENNLSHKSPLDIAREAATGENATQESKEIYELLKHAAKKF